MTLGQIGLYIYVNNTYMNLNLASVILNYWLYFILTVTFDVITGPSEQPYCLQSQSPRLPIRSPRISTTRKAGWSVCIRNYKGKLS